MKTHVPVNNFVIFFHHFRDFLNILLKGLLYYIILDSFKRIHILVRGVYLILEGIGLRDDSHNQLPLKKQ